MRAEKPDTILAANAFARGCSDHQLADALERLSDNGTLNAQVCAQLVESAKRLRERSA